MSQKPTLEPEDVLQQYLGKDAQGYPTMDYDDVLLAMNSYLTDKLAEMEERGRILVRGPWRVFRDDPPDPEKLLWVGQRTSGRVHLVLYADDGLFHLVNNFSITLKPENYPEWLYAHAPTI